MDSAGNRYGTTYQGGTSNYGTVFKVDPAGKETVLYSFTGINGDEAYPQAGLIRDSTGNLYGTTTTGGITDGNPYLGNCGNGCGTVFVVTP